MSKHVAAGMYGGGSRLDTKPELLFRLRAVNENDLVADIGKVLPMSKRGPAAGKVLEADDMAALFGLDMGEAAEPAEAVAPPAGTQAAAGRKKVATGVKVGAGKAAPATTAARAKGATPGKAEPKPVAWWKPGTLKQPGKSRVAAAATVRPTPGRKVKLAS